MYIWLDGSSFTEECVDNKSIGSGMKTFTMAHNKIANSDKEKIINT